MPASAVSHERLACERCHAFVSVEANGDERPRLRCTVCSISRELTDAEVVQVSRPSAVARAISYPLGPESVSMTAKSEPKRVSASSLLDFAPPSSQPKLLLSPDDTNPNIGDLVAKAKMDEKKPDTTDDAAAGTSTPEEAPPESLETLDAAALEDDDGEEEPSPLSLRDGIVDEPEPHETVSLKDVVVVPAVGTDSTPPPPARGALRTLPPTPSKRTGDAAPPPTITVEEEKKAESVPPLRARSLPPPLARRTSEPPPRSTTTSTMPPAARTPVAATAPPPGEAKRSWIMPALVVAGIGIVLWRMMAGPARPDPAPPVATIEPSATHEPPAPTIIASAAPTESATIPTVAPRALPSATTATPAATGSAARIAKPAATGDAPGGVGEKKPPAGDGLTMSDLLDRAGGAKRSGDYATARELYQKVLGQNPGNVEANGGLGDVARAQGDLPAARTSYERALAASPSYGPAQLGLADVEWDLGNQAGARKRYQQMLERLGSRAPARVKERGAVE